MCGVFGSLGPSALDPADLKVLVRHSEQRGRDSSGLVIHDAGRYEAFRADRPATQLLDEVGTGDWELVFGHSRLITNGSSDNQPVIRGGVCVIHNGIVVNHEELWETIQKDRHLQIDTEIIAAIAEDHVERGGTVDGLPARILDLCEGIVACALALPKLGKLVLFSNNGSLYLGDKAPSGHVFASESHPLHVIGCSNIRQVRDAVVLDIPISRSEVDIKESRSREVDLVPPLILTGPEERLLQYPQPDLRRCTRCILPSTMPFIRFDTEGVCNYCLNYSPRNIPRPKEELFELVEQYRRASGDECIVPFSGGRDSSYALHLIVNDLQMRPVTYTYDWGMITDLGRRNISRMCAELGVENIIVADDISKKRRNISMNLQAWLASPHLGMLSVLTAGDKHFFRHVETVKKQTGLGLNLWGINPLEVTHFKAGFLGVPPDFEEEHVYSHGAAKQLRYQSLRLRAMLHSPGYFNSSLWDTLSGEYYRSFTKKSDYFHVFDYWHWDEQVIDDELDSYDWERAPDTQTTWRIGDGTAAFYNYVYYTIAGFSEHDTFRSNQIREGELTRAEALDLVKVENQPRYPNIKWYLDAIGLEFQPVMATVNSVPRLYER